ncbi:MAG: hypothetical protein ABS920_15280, partial [Sporosarcina sp.]
EKSVILSFRKALALLVPSSLESDEVPSLLIKKFHLLYGSRSIQSNPRAIIHVLLCVRSSY